MMRYLGLFWIQLRASLLLAMQYRIDFFLTTGLSLFLSACALVPLVVLFSHRDGVAGWSWPDSLVVVSFFLMLKGLLSALVIPTVNATVEHVRNGTMDFLLLKPADAQFLVSTNRFEPARAADTLAGAALLGYALSIRGEPVSLAQATAAAVLCLGGVVILYSIFVSVLSLSFHVVKVDNLVYLMTSIFDAARWPAAIFRGLWAVLFTFVLPLALMTTYPAMALTGRLGAGHLAGALAVATGFAAASRWLWRSAVASYTSAGG